jgi:hypothetical protein
VASRLEDDASRQRVVTATRVYVGTIGPAVLLSLARLVPPRILDKECAFALLEELGLAPLRVDDLEKPTQILEADGSGLSCDYSSPPASHSAKPTSTVRRVAVCCWGRWMSERVFNDGDLDDYSDRFCPFTPSFRLRISTPVFFSSGLIFRFTRYHLFHMRATIISSPRLLDVPCAVCFKMPSDAAFHDLARLPLHLVYPSTIQSICGASRHSGVHSCVTKPDPQAEPGRRLNVNLHQRNPRPIIEFDPFTQCFKPPGNGLC